MERYSKIISKTQREILLLKGAPCKWGKCTFCDYIDDNAEDQTSNHDVNIDIIEQVTGEYGVLEVINSGNIFELPKATLEALKQCIDAKGIDHLFFEAHWIYREHIQRMRDFFGIKVTVKTGIESFDYEFRETVLNKGIGDPTIDEIKKYFDSVCLMVGIKGQTKSGIQQDIDLAKKHFKHFTVNVYVNNSTTIQQDPKLVQWFEEKYWWLDTDTQCDILWNNTDFGVG
jgi:radical SAM superfamily enzyme YgiQ (UPF0313 family)